MKTNYQYLKTLGLALCLNLSAISSHAQSPEEVPEEVNAQISITHDAIQNILNKIDSGGTSQSFKSGDYLRTVGVFKSRIEQGTITFENRLRNNILPKVSFYIERYNSIYRSKDLADSQKNLLLQQQMEQMVAHLADVSKEYQSALADLYYSVNLPFRYETAAEWKGDSGNSRKDRKLAQESCGSLYQKNSYFSLLDILLKNDRSGLEIRGPICRSHQTENWIMPSVSEQTILVTVNSRNIDYVHEFLTKNKEVYNRMIFPAVSEGCQSQVCLALRASDLATFIGMVKSKLDHNLVFRLANGKRVGLTPVDQDITLLTGLLSVTQYPGDPLPFDAN